MNTQETKGHQLNLPPHLLQGGKMMPEAESRIMPGFLPDHCYASEILENRIWVGMWYLNGFNSLREVAWRSSDHQIISLSAHLAINTFTKNHSSRVT